MAEKPGTEAMRDRPIKSIVKAATVLNLLAQAGGPMSLSHMARSLNISKSTLHGIVATLVDVKFLAQDPETGHYKLGMRLFEIGTQMSNQWDERKIAYPYIQEIMAEIGETVHMAVLDDYEVLYINKQEADGSIRIVTAIGVRLPAHCTGVGKALLSGLSYSELKCMVRIKGLKRYTAATITELDSLWAELEQVQLKGYAVDEQEYMEGLRCVAVPIFNHAGRIAASLSVSGPVSRMQQQKFQQCKQSLLKAAKNISGKLGYEG